MTVLAPLRVSEAADSLVKASTPQPFSTSTTSNWVARSGGLPPYVQHIAHALVTDGKPESEAIETAMGVVKNPPADWDATAKAACAKAVGELAAKKVATKKVGKVTESLSLADRVTLRTASGERLAIFEETLGVDGMLALVEAPSAPVFKPELKRVASASQEKERFELHDDGQHVGTIASRAAYDRGKPDRWRAQAVNGRTVGDMTETKAGAIDAVKKHLEDAPGRIAPSPTDGRFLVSEPESYSGPTKYMEYPSESSARYASGLPEQKTSVEQAAEVASLGEMIGFDVLMLRALTEGAPAQFDALAEAIDANGDAEQDGDADDSRFQAGDRVNFQHPTAGRVRARVSRVTSQHVHLTSSDPRVGPTRMTVKQADSKLSMTRAMARESVAVNVLGALLDCRVQEDTLTTRERAKLPPSEFVYPEKAPGPGSYPIETREHAVDALARGADPANAGSLADIQKKVWAKYPDLKPGKDGK